MDVTPPAGMFKAMQNFVDSTIGEAPTAIETTPAAERRRQARKEAMDFLHNIVRLSMRVGVARFCEERGLPVVRDDIQPTPKIGGAPASENIALPSRH